jgi:acetyl esterase
MSITYPLLAWTIPRVFGLPDAIKRRMAGKARTTEGHELDVDLQLLCKAHRLVAPPTDGNLQAIQALRGMEAALAPSVAAPFPHDVSVERMSIPGVDGRLELEILRPPGNTPRPLLLWLHGGGFVMGGLASHRAPLATLAREADILVAHVDYRLAPEHPFPAAFLDARHAWLWLQHHAEGLGASSRLAIGGDSAGGNLAGAVSRDRARHGGASPDLQVLVYPWVDTLHEAPSYEELAEGFFLTRDRVRWFIDQVFHDPADRHDPRIHLLGEPIAAGEPPAILVSAGFDVLRDECRAYAAKLDAGGLLLDHLHEPSLLHGFLNFTGLSHASLQAHLRLSQRIGQHLHR